MPIAIALELIHQLDVASDSRWLSSEEIGLWKTLKRKLLGLCSLERSITRQKSRLLWLRDGDASTQFFHQHASNHRRRNAITVLQNNGEILTGQEKIVKVVDDYYETILGTTPERAHSLNLGALQLPTLNLAHLEEPFLGGGSGEGNKGNVARPCLGPGWVHWTFLRCVLGNHP